MKSTIDNNTRKFPRTMEEAFGPYHRSSGQFEEAPTVSTKSIIAYIFVLVCAIIAAHVIASN